jgi:aryl-alcohol dehydrogenase-like predicted oxidoreductase
MEKRKLGGSSLEIAPLVLGGNVFGWTIDENSSFKVLDSFLEAGFQMVDTADVYSAWAEGNKGGESETIIGKWTRARKNRQQVLIATKAGGDMGKGKNLKKEYIIQAAEASLQRLQTDYIDLYQAHFDDPDTTVDETLEAFSRLIDQGKVRAIGASNFSRARLSEAVETSEKKKLPRYQSFQPRYNLYDREEFEKEYQQFCISNQLGVIPYYGLASGFLTGKYRSENDLSKSKRGGGISKYLNQRGYRILEALDELSSRYKVNVASVSLAWLMAQPGITAPIASATSPEQLQDLTRAAGLKLDQQAIEKLNEASAY